MQTTTVYQEITLDTPTPVINAITADADTTAGSPVYYDASGEPTCNDTETIEEEEVPTTMYAMALETVKSGELLHVLLRGDVDASGLTISKKNAKAFSNIGIICRHGV